jgi:DNA-binding transcriptional regulator LsrR (DeoR family)
MNIKSNRKDIRFQGKQRQKLKQKIKYLHETCGMTVAEIARSLGLSYELTHNLWKEVKKGLVAAEEKTS